MATGIDDFLSIVSNGGGIAMSNMYRVKLPSLRRGEIVQNLNILCSKVDLPLRQITTIDSRSGVDVEKVAYGYAVADVAMSFYLLNDYAAKDYFDTWQSICLNQETLESGYPDEYCKTVVIEQLKKGIGFPVAKKKLFDAGKIPSPIRSRLPRLGPLDFAQGEFDLNLIKKEDVVYTCTLERAFPTSISAIPLSAAGGGLLEVNVQLSFKNWKGESSYKDTAFGDAVTGGLLQVARGLF